MNIKLPLSFGNYYSVQLFSFNGSTNIIIPLRSVGRSVFSFPSD